MRDQKFSYANKMHFDVISFMCPPPPQTNKKADQVPHPSPHPQHLKKVVYASDICIDVLMDYSLLLFQRLKRKEFI